VLSPASSRDDSIGYYLSRTAVYGGSIPAALQHAYYDSARIILEPLVEELPESPHDASFLGIAYAGLGRTEEAIREGKRAALDLSPLSKDAWVGSVIALDLAEIYVMVGEYEAAIDQLDFVLSIAGYVSVAWLKADPLWDPLRDNPRFQELLEKYGDQQH
jgi:tetratricopeptide (TPR) repeat protein